MITFLVGVAAGLALVLFLGWLDRCGLLWQRRRRRRRSKQASRRLAHPAKVVPIEELQRLWAKRSPNNAKAWPSEVVVRAEMRRLTAQLAAASEVAELHGFGPLLDSVLDSIDERSAR